MIMNICLNSWLPLVVLEVETQVHSSIVHKNYLLMILLMLLYMLLNSNCFCKVRLLI